MNTVILIISAAIVLYATYAICGVNRYPVFIWSHVKACVESKLSVNADINTRLNNSCVLAR